MIANEKEIALGTSVSITSKMVRMSKYNRDSRGVEKYWEIRNFKQTRTGILLGFRTISNGRVVHDYEDGNYFVPKEYYRVALVCLNKHENPIYVSKGDVICLF